jgi:hypothetical protein
MTRRARSVSSRRSSPIRRSLLLADPRGIDGGLGGKIPNTEGLLEGGLLAEAVERLEDDPASRRAWTADSSHRT